MTALDSYLGWDLLPHRPDCANPAWIVDVRTKDGEFRSHHGGSPHSCPNEECGHSDRYTATTVRIVCTSCGVAETITGETDSENTGRSSDSTRSLGYGLPPRQLSGLLLWPGEPFLSWGRLATPEPWDFVVTRLGVVRVTEADVVGLISQGRTPRGSVRWPAVAVRDDAGQYGYAPLRFAQGREDLKTPTAAARWIAAQLAAVEKNTRAGCVHSATGSETHVLPGSPR